MEEQPAIVPRVQIGLPPALAGTVALDVELYQADKDRLHRETGYFASLAICGDGKTVYLVTDEKDIPKALKLIDRAEWVFHNGQFDLFHLRRWAKVPPRTFLDTMLIERILWSGWYDSFGLDDLARRYLQLRLNKQPRGLFSQTQTMSEEMRQYAVLDALVTWRIAKEQRKHMTPAYWKVWYEVDCPTVWAVLDMKGFPLDTKLWCELAQEASQTATTLRESLGFNPGSPAQTRMALRDYGAARNIRGLQRLTSTEEDNLTPYKDEPIVRDILAYREMTKRAGTYGMKWLEYVEEDGCIYGNYNVTGAKTGRMSSSDPINMQNIPHKTDPRYRKAWVAKRGFRILKKDYRQQEPNITAELTKDPELVRAINAQEDLHLTAAKAIYNNPNLTKDNKRERSHGKTINLGLVYGLTAAGMAAKTDLDVATCQRLLNSYFARFKGIADWMRRTRAQAARQGYVETLSGRRMYLNPYAYQSANNAINTPVQGTAADITKTALVLFHAKTKAAMPVVAVVHDEIVLRVKTAEVPAMSRLLDECMTKAFLRYCPHANPKNLVETTLGPTWEG